MTDLVRDLAERAATLTLQEKRAYYPGMMGMGGYQGMVMPGYHAFHPGHGHAATSMTGPNVLSYRTGFGTPVNTGQHHEHGRPLRPGHDQRRQAPQSVREAALQSPDLSQEAEAAYGS